MRIFLSYHTSDRPLALALKAAIEKARPTATVFFDESHLRYGHFWQPSLFSAIAEADAFLIVVGNSIGDWQKAEYYDAFDKKIKDPERFLLLPIITADKTKGPIPNLPGLTQLHWIETTEPTASESLAKILSALDGDAAKKPSEPWRTINPYRGLLALEEQDAEFFFGREAKTNEILGSIVAAKERLIALIGNSGVGKTSLVQAGLIASLKRQRRPSGGLNWPKELSESREWAYITFRPADNPFRALVSAFTSLWLYDPTDPKRFARLDEWEARLRGAGRLPELIDATQSHYRELGNVSPPGVFIYIDQGEELYSRNGADTIRQFSELLASGISDPRLIVTTSLRSDFYGHLQTNEALFSKTVRIDVPPLAFNELKTVLHEPAQVLGVSFESEGVVSQLVNDCRDQAGALPLLADFITDLWGRMQIRGDGVLRIVEKEEILQIGGALARRADWFVASHSNDGDTVRRLFSLKLAIIQDAGPPTRRRVFFQDCTPLEQELIQELANAKWRLVVTGEDQGRVYAEVAHEVLLREWATLRTWLEEQRGFLIWKADVDRAYRRWSLTPLRQKREALLFGLPLADAIRWNRLGRADIDPPVRAFIIRSAEAKFFSLWSAIIFFLSIVLFLIYMVVIVPQWTGHLGLLFVYSCVLSVASGLTMRMLAGVGFRWTVGLFDFRSRAQLPFTQLEHLERATTSPVALRARIAAVSEFEALPAFHQRRKLGKPAIHDLNVAVVCIGILAVATSTATIYLGFMKEVLFQYLGAFNFTYFP